MNRLKQLAQNIRKNPDDTFSKFALGLEFLKMGNNQDALSLFKNIEKNDPDYVGLYYHLGKLYTEIGENNMALNTYKKGIQIAESQNDAHARNELQAALFELESELE